MKTKDIEIAISNYCLRELKHNLVVPRCSVLGFEADILSVTSTAFLHEFEIKISRSDFLADSKKSKWKHYNNLELCPNYFWYACPVDLIKPDELKDHHGLIYFHDKGFKLIKKPSRMQSKKCHKRIYVGMVRSLTWKLLNESIKLRTIQNKSQL